MRELQATLVVLGSLLIFPLVATTAMVSLQGHSSSVNTNGANASITTEEPKYPTEGVDPFQPDPVIRQIPGYELVWHDEFNVDGPPDPQKWNFEHGFVRNRELQWYQKDNAYCKGGVLIIEGRKERIPNPNYDPNSDDWRRSRQYAEYTSASLNTWGKFAWKLSEVRIVARARIHPQPGYFPAIWTTGPGIWPHGGEVDIMECYRDRIHANFAWGTTEKYSPRWKSFSKPISEFIARDPDWLKKFHIWELIGDDEKLQILLDGEVMNEVSQETAKNPPNQWSTVVYPFREKHSVILNLAIGGPGGDPSGAKFPMIFEVDYVRVYRRISGKGGE